MSTCKINNFCYVCGKFLTEIGENREKRELRENVHFQELYRLYFSVDVILDEDWAPDFACCNCYNYLVLWSQKKKKEMPFGAPIMWTDPGDHDKTTCYGCVNFKTGLNKKKAKNMVLKSTVNADLTKPHSDAIPVPKCPSGDAQTFYSFDTDYTEASNAYSMYEPGPSNAPKFVTQRELDRLVAQLNLSQKKSEQIASFLKAHNILDPGVKVTGYRGRQRDFKKLYELSEDKKSAYCTDVDALMKAIGIKYRAKEWRLFVDSAKTSLKAILLDEKNVKPAVPIAYSTDTEETYEKLKIILEKVKYVEHKWKICCDLKVVQMLCGMQGGYTRHMCFMCDWNTRFDRQKQYKTHSWKLRDESEHRDANKIREALVPKENVLLPPLHVKLGIVKNFIKAVVAANSKAFDVLKQIFNLSPDRLRNGVCYENLNEFVFCF